MLFDESFWVSFSIIIFMLIVFRYLKTPISHSLSKRAGDISVRIAEAEKLKKEALETLREFELLYNNAKQEIKIFAEHLDEEIEFLKKKAEQDLKEKLRIRENIIDSRVRNLEEKTLAKMRLKAIKLAVTVSIFLLRENSSKEINFAFIEKSLQTMNLSNI